MIILMHVSSAFASLSTASYRLLVPYYTLILRNIWTFIGATFISGAYLVVSTHPWEVLACISGLVYLTVARQYRFVHVRSDLNRTLEKSLITVFSNSEMSMKL
jgi:hypothetical protein